MLICQAKDKFVMQMVPISWALAIWCALSTINTPSHNLCGFCDLASKLNLVTGDEQDIYVSIVLFRNQIILRWCRVVCVAILYVT